METRTRVKRAYTAIRVRPSTHWRIVGNRALPVNWGLRTWGLCSKSFQISSISGMRATFWSKRTRSRPMIRHSMNWEERRENQHQYEPHIPALGPPPALSPSPLSYWCRSPPLSDAEAAGCWCHGRRSAGGRCRRTWLSASRSSAPTPCQRNQVPASTTAVWNLKLKHLLFMEKRKMCLSGLAPPPKEWDVLLLQQDVQHAFSQPQVFTGNISTWMWTHNMRSRPLMTPDVLNLPVSASHLQSVSAASWRRHQHP